eukprot:GHVT01065669.1.p1 GENE.GHVT01065669.1~~GHVT01065669.1.p1  ORF type:complete len:280 (+),score=6.74 GHVT01065669.1:98-841(+)
MEVGMPDVKLRWLQYVFTFDVEIEYRPGRLHGNADRLSRPPRDEPCGARACVCTTAAENIATAERSSDGEPDLEVHPEIPVPETTMIAAVTRSRKDTTPTAVLGKSEPEHASEEGIFSMDEDLNILCGQPEQLVPDILIYSEAEENDDGREYGGFTDLLSDADLLTMGEQEIRPRECLEDLLHTPPEQDPDVPTSDSDETSPSDIPDVHNDISLQDLCQALDENSRTPRASTTGDDEEIQRLAEMAN